ncbi:unnamed protein product [Penicillium salamii]|nr:unnamed protein product [Penicillium salamii]
MHTNFYTSTQIHQNPNLGVRLEENQREPTRSLLLAKLPSEIIHVIISHLSAPDLACVGATCRALAEHASNDLLWANLINARLPHRIENPGIFKTFRRLFLAYYPCWFIPEHKIWFADNEPTGSLILTRYDNRRGVIEGYEIVAERGSSQFHFWKAEPTVLVQAFDPKVRLSLDEPALFLKDPDPSSKSAPIQHLSRTNDWKLPLAHEANRIYKPLLLCSAISDQQESITDPGQYWPPPTVPSRAHTSRSGEDSQQQLVGKLSDMSEEFFRLDRLQNYRTLFADGNGKYIQTYSALDPESYTPTKEKPYQGLWVGDYSTHGCEFILVLQTREQGDIQREGWDIETNNHDGTIEADTSETIGHQGQLQGIKLTGDMNVPRGQYSWVSEDIGPAGLVGVAVDEPFTGARMVRCKGHVAGIGFQDDIFIDSQLILISTDLMAHYWKEMGHISYFRRVDIDALLQT